MKKLVKSILMLSIASLAILSSCKKDSTTDVTDVKVDITYVPSSPVQGNAVTFTLTLTGNTDNKLKTVSFTRSGGGAADKTLLSKSYSVSTATETVVDTPGLGTYTYTVAVTGEKGSPATKTITVITRQPYGTLQSTPVAIDLNGQTQDSTQNYFMKLTSPFTPFDRGRATFAANKANIDACFFYGNANQATIASPDDAVSMQTVYTYINWTGAKKTQFAPTSITATQFDAIKVANSDSAIVELAKTISSWNVSATKLAKDNVVIYKTAEGKYGLIKVQNLLGNSASTAIISVNILSQN